MENKILLVDADFYKDIADELVRGAVGQLEERNLKYDRVSVPGALEIPPAIAAISRQKSIGPYIGYVALGCVIRGETSHYDIVSNESARGLMNLSVEQGLAIGNGILTCLSMKQAKERKRKLLDSIGRDAYNGVNLFEGTTPAPTPTSGQGQGPLDGVSPNDPGVDISNIFSGHSAKIWQKLSGKN